MFFRVNINSRITFLDTLGIFTSSIRVANICTKIFQKRIRDKLLNSIIVKWTSTAIKWLITN
jgi:hypothetical protein